MPSSKSDGGVAPDGSSSLRVLVVEDDTTFAEFVGELLRPVASTTHRVATLADALVEILADDVDCVVLDLGLPDAEDLQAVEAIGALHDPPPVVVLTGDDDPERSIAALAGGAQDYLPKRDVSRTSLERSVRYAVERHRLEAELRVSSRMEIVGRLAGRVAHDLNNVLMAVFGHIELARLELDHDDGADPMREHLDAIEHAATRTAELTRELLAYGKAGGRGVDVVSAIEVVDGLVQVLQPALGGCPVVVERPGRSDHVRLTRSQLEEILTNLLVNARDAMVGGGTIDVSVRVVDDPDGIGDPSVVIRVSDTGPGVDVGLRSRVFEPLFTTKSDGSGLGLSSVKSLVEGADGRISIGEREGGGAVFTVELPWRSAPSVLEVPDDDTEDLATVRVLVVDDDAPVRRFVSRVLAGLGHEVTELPGPTDAVSTLDERPHDLVVSDIVMPDGDGRALARELRRRWPDLPVILMSAYASPDVDAPHDGDVFDDLGVSFLAKPFGGEDLRRAVRRALQVTPT